MNLNEKYEDKHTLAWHYYELGKAYNESLVPSQYNVVNTNIDFFSGNQWVNLAQSEAMQRLPKPVFNILKRIISLKVASLTSSSVTVAFEPLSYYDGENVNDPETNASVYATAEVRNLFDKFKFDYRCREALFYGAITGDYAAHYWFDPDAMPYGGAFGAQRGEIRMELVDGVNVMFGNPNEHDVQTQPYIILVGRDTVGNLKEEMEAARKRKRRKADDELCEIQPDSDYPYESGIGGKTEIQAGDDTQKCTYLYLYTKKTHDEDVIDPNTGNPLTEDVVGSDGKPVYEKDENGKPFLDTYGKPIVKKRVVKHPVTTVYVSKCTRTAVIYEDVDTGLTRYPVAFGNWEQQKNQYHGRAEVTGLIPNQIYINKMFALLMQWTQLAAFPKYVYNADLIPRWTNEIGQAIAIHNLQPGATVDGAASMIRPAELSTQIINAIDKTMSYTKECLGATDAQMGNMRAENTSALMVLQNAGEVPLENPRQLFYEWVEDSASILLDMMGTYYGKRNIVMEKEFDETMTDSAGNPLLDPETGMMQTTKVKRRVIQEFDFSQFKNLWFNVRVDVGATSYYSELATVQILDNLLANNIIDVQDYLERMPDKFIPRREELIDKMKQFNGEQLARQETASAPVNTVSELDDAKAFSKLTPGQQSQYNSLPKYAQRQLTKIGRMKS